jgi:protein CpxP
MLHSNRRMGIAFVRTRSLTLAALMSAPLAAVPLTMVHAASATGGEVQLAQARTTATNPAGDRADNVEQQIANLHAQLKVTPDQESHWNGVAQVMRDNAANMEKLVAEKRQKGPQNMTAVDDLMSYQEIAQAHVDGLKRLTSAFKSLYDSMPDAQKKNADKVFANLHRTNMQRG